jgi:hypothetical protein
MKSKIDAMLIYLAARAAVPGTWQGIAFLLTLAGSHYAQLDWGQCAAIGATASGVLKILLPDAKPPADIIIQNIHPEVQAAIAPKDAQ